MKKWMNGLLLGVAFTLLTAAVSSSTIQGTLFPSMVTVHNGNEAKTMDVTEDGGVINYKGKAYVPLRLFSEAMGASVGYEPASEATNGMHKIDIYQGVAPIQWNLVRTEDVFPKSQDFCRSFPMPFYIMPTNSESLGDTRNFKMRVHSLMNEDITVEPIELTFEITDEAGQVVYSRPLPPLSGVIPGNFGFYAEVSWDHTGLDGLEVPSGNYFIKLKRPDKVSYKVLDSDEEQSVGINRAMGCNLELFRITI
jgi:hypothetical protein